MFVGLAMIGVWDGGPEGWLLGRWGVCSAGSVVLGGGVGTASRLVDRWFGLELLRLDCYMCDLYF